MKKLFYVFFFSLSFFGCTNSEIDERNSYKNSDNPAQITNPVIKVINYLALGDSYTIGERVCATCRFPEQLKSALTSRNNVVNVQVIAQTGWTTTNLKSAIALNIPSNTYDIATLLIGVNNQYQNKPFSLYEQEFPELVNTVIAKVGGNKNRLIVVSIPDYAFTPFGGGSTSISNALAQYNSFAESYCTTNNITFVNITDITQQGIINPALVASDGLHPSELAYSKFVQRILPKAKLVLGL